MANKMKHRVRSLTEGDIDVDAYDPMAELLKFRNMLVIELNDTLNGGFEVSPPVSDFMDPNVRGLHAYNDRDHAAKIVAEIQAIDKELMPYKYPKLRSQETKIEAGDSITDLLRELNGR